MDPSRAKLHIAIIPDTVGRLSRRYRASSSLLCRCLCTSQWRLRCKRCTCPRAKLRFISNSAINEFDNAQAWLYSLCFAFWMIMLAFYIFVFLLWVLFVSVSVNSASNCRVFLYFLFLFKKKIIYSLKSLVFCICIIMYVCIYTFCLLFCVAAAFLVNEDEYKSVINLNLL